MKTEIFNIIDNKLTKIIKSKEDFILNIKKTNLKYLLGRLKSYRIV